MPVECSEASELLAQPLQCFASGCARVLGLLDVCLGWCHPLLLADARRDRVGGRNGLSVVPEPQDAADFVSALKQQWQIA